jgi:hypothetical protein
MPVCHAFLSDPKFYSLLVQVDQDIAAEVRAGGCACGGVLHSARYPRKPRGVRSALDETEERRLSFCCAREGCRRRSTPPSVRFLGRRVYLGAVVVLATALRHGLTTRRMGRLQALLGVSPRTLKRWRSWWRESFVGTPFWKAVQGRFSLAVEAQSLPGSLLERFGGDEPTRLVKLLLFLAPLTTASARFSRGGG